MKNVPDAQKLVDYYSAKTLRINSDLVKVSLSGEYRSLMWVRAANHSPADSHPPSGLDWDGDPVSLLQASCFCHEVRGGHALDQEGEESKPRAGGQDRKQEEKTQIQRKVQRWVQSREVQVQWWVQHGKKSRSPSRSGENSTENRSRSREKTVEPEKSEKLGKRMRNISCNHICGVRMFLGYITDFIEFYVMLQKSFYFYLYWSWIIFHSSFTYLISFDLSETYKFNERFHCFIFRNKTIRLYSSVQTLVLDSELSSESIIHQDINLYHVSISWHIIIMKCSIRLKFDTQWVEISSNILQFKWMFEVRIRSEKLSCRIVVDETDCVHSQSLTPNLNLQSTDRVKKKKKKSESHFYRMFNRSVNTSLALQQSVHMSNLWPAGRLQRTATSRGWRWSERMWTMKTWRKRRERRKMNIQQREVTRHKKVQIELTENKKQTITKTNC